MSDRQNDRPPPLQAPAATPLSPASSPTAQVDACWNLIAEYEATIKDIAGGPSGDPLVVRKTAGLQVTFAAYNPANARIYYRSVIRTALNAEPAELPVRQMALAVGAGNLDLLMPVITLLPQLLQKAVYRNVEEQRTHRQRQANIDYCTDVLRGYRDSGKVNI